MKRAISIGGIFFKSKNPAALRKWYADHLDFEVEDWGCKFEWQQPGPETGEADTVWSPFRDDTRYFDPSPKPYMINLVVHDLYALREQLKLEGVMVMEETEESEFGKFGWIMDPEENKIELWEPSGK